MELTLQLNTKLNDLQITYTDKVMLIGSCFTEHIGNFLKEHKFSVLQNPNGILFDTLSVCRCLTSYISDSKVQEESLFQYNELWQHWQYHSVFSAVEKAAALAKMQTAQQEAKQFIENANWLIITLGSSFAYKLTNLATNNTTEKFVANCHKAPGQWFEKYFIPIEEQIATLDQTIYRLRKVNPNLKIIFTISPVRHIRDGVVENNRSKARLIETVHHLIQKFNHLYYFPAYEMVIDVLRDYRFYDIDMVHPNYSATNYVIEKFIQSFISKDAIALLERIKPIIIARKHKAFHPTSIAHKKFLAQNREAILALNKENKQLDFTEELEYFSNFSI